MLTIFYSGFPLVDKNNVHGENLAANYGSGSWAAVRSADTILSRWVEDEADDPYPANGHLTQVLWRPSKYVGCAEASAPDGGGLCHVQVCRYARPGKLLCSHNPKNGLPSLILHPKIPQATVTWTRSITA